MTDITMSGTGAPRPWPGYVALALALTGALAFNAVSLWMAGFLWNLPGLTVTVSGTVSGTVPGALATDLGLILLFGLQHSLMARAWARRAIARSFGDAAVRGVFNIASSLALAAVFWFWQPIGAPVWDLTASVAGFALYTLGAAGLVLVIRAQFAIDPMAFLGISDACDRIAGRRPAKPRFVTPGPYRAVRHPMQLGALIFVWATPLMTPGHLLFALAMTVYVFIGLHFEERALIREFGDTYRNYRRRVPMLLPRLRLLPQIDPPGDDFI